MAYEPIAGQYEKEHRYSFETKDPSGPHVVFSGNVDVGANLHGDPQDDDQWELHNVILTVGPWWLFLDPKDVVPSVTVSGYQNTNSDEDDQQGWRVEELTVDTIGGDGIHADEERIRLKFNVWVKGQNSNVIRLSYFVFARGRALGKQGLNSP
jgi:hypothetical protein